MFSSQDLQMTAEAIAKALGGHKADNSWTARYPARDDHHPSLSIRDGDEHEVLVKRFSGCCKMQGKVNWNGRA